MNNVLKLLIVDDDAAIVKILSSYFEKHGVNITTAVCAEELMAHPFAQSVDIILLDLFLPDVHGFELLEKLRKKFPNTGIIVMTGNEDPVDKVVGLELGADDYINKPFELRELLARIRSLYRRTNNALIPETLQDVEKFEDAKYLLFNSWRFEIRTRFLYSPEHDLIRLTSLETSLLFAFLKSDNKVMDRNKLLKEVFMRDWRPDDRSIDILISKLRKKLREKDVIVNERSRGYRWTPNINIIR